MVFLKAEGEKAPEAQSIAGPWASRFSDLARELKITILMGSFPETADETGRPYNTTILFGPTGSGSVPEDASFRHRRAEDGLVPANTGDLPFTMAISINGWRVWHLFMQSPKTPSSIP